MKIDELIILKLDTLEKKVDVCIVDIAGLKVKSGIWGALAGLIPVSIALTMWIMSTQ